MLSPGGGTQHEGGQGRAQAEEECQQLHMFLFGSVDRVLCSAQAKAGEVDSNQKQLGFLASFLRVLSKVGTRGRPWA